MNDYMSWQANEQDIQIKFEKENAHFTSIQMHETLNQATNYIMQVYVVYILQTLN